MHLNTKILKGQIKVIKFKVFTQSYSYLEHIFNHKFQFPSNISWIRSQSNETGALRILTEYDRVCHQR